MRSCYRCSALILGPGARAWAQGPGPEPRGCGPEYYLLLVFVVVLLASDDDTQRATTRII